MKGAAVGVAKKAGTKGATNAAVAGKKRARNEMAASALGGDGDGDVGSEFDAGEYGGGAPGGAQFAMPDFGAGIGMGGAGGPPGSLSAMLRAESDYGGGDTPLPPGALMGLPMPGPTVAVKGGPGGPGKKGGPAGKKKKGAASAGWDY